jgi:hypothetical protein
MYQLFMFDDITVGALPYGAKAYAGYVDGIYKNFADVKAKFPQAAIVSIAVFAKDDAEVLDVEQGDATIADVYAWLKRQLARGVWRPVIYTSAGNVDRLMLTMNANGFKRDQYRIWSAHYTNRAHLCGPTTCGEIKTTTADWTQFTSRANNSSLDESLLGDEPVFTAPKPPQPQPQPQPKPPVPQPGPKPVIVTMAQAMDALALLDRYVAERK